MVIVEQLVGQASIGVRVTISLLFRTPAARLRVRVPDYVVRNEEIEPAIVVVVQPPGRNGPHLRGLRIRARNPGVDRDIGKAAVSQVAVEDVAVNPGDEE